MPAKDKIVKGHIIISKGELVSKEKFEILNSFRMEVDKTIVSTSDYVFLLGEDSLLRLLYA